jgi:hypothetical protein
MTLSPWPNVVVLDTTPLPVKVLDNVFAADLRRSRSWSPSA